MAALLGAGMSALGTLGSTASGATSMAAMEALSAQQQAQNLRMGELSMQNALSEAQANLTKKMGESIKNLV